MPKKQRGKLLFPPLLTQGSALSPSFPPPLLPAIPTDPSSFGATPLLLVWGNTRGGRGPLRATRTRFAQTRGLSGRTHDRFPLSQTLSSPTAGLLAALKGSGNKKPFHAAFVLPQGPAAPWAQFLLGSCTPHCGGGQLQDLGQTKLNHANKA